MKDRRFIDVDVCINRLKELMKEAPDEQCDYFIQLSNEIEAEFHAQEAEQELFLKLPCKVGDYVYQLDRTNKKVITQKVQGITLYMGRKSFSMQIVFETTGMCFHREFGTSVFLNKKEAMQALKELSSRGST